jgi:hypothetical protein
MIDYTGKKKNHLTALYFTKRVNGRTYWAFCCDCGKIKEFRPDKVFLSHSYNKFCGDKLCKFSTRKKSIKFIDKESRNDCSYEKLILFKRIYSRYKSRAKKSGFEFSISFDFFYEKINSKCHYCGVPPNRELKSKNTFIFYNGIDRKDNEVGYKEVNCLPCCHFCNYAKKTNPYEKFIGWINQVKSSGMH